MVIKTNMEQMKKIGEQEKKIAKKLDSYSKTLEQQKMQLFKNYNEDELNKIICRAIEQLESDLKQESRKVDAMGQTLCRISDTYKSTEHGIYKQKPILEDV